MHDKEWEFWHKLDTRARAVERQRAPAANLLPFRLAERQATATSVSTYKTTEIRKPQQIIDGPPRAANLSRHDPAITRRPPPYFGQIVAEGDRRLPIVNASEKPR